MRVLLFNAGSSSLSARLFEVQGGQPPLQLARAKAHRVGGAGAEPSFVEVLASSGQRRQQLPLPHHGVAAGALLDLLLDLEPPPEALGHRLVHGGSHFPAPALLAPEDLPRLEASVPLAPIHNPATLAVLGHCLARFPGLPQFVAPDTAFHSGLPARAAAWPSGAYQDLPKAGFHGLSYAFVVERVGQHLGRPAKALDLVLAHLGTGGSSACVVRGGRSLDTTMGFTPLPGLVMSTRCGDLDPMLLPALARRLGRPLADLEPLLNNRSGVLGLSGGVSSDLRDLQRLAQQGDPKAEAVLHQSAARTASYLGAYLLLLPRCDGLVFTDDLGARFPALTSRICAHLGFLGLRLAPNPLDLAPDLRQLSSPDSRLPVLAVDTDEELLILRSGLPLLGGAHASDH